LMQGEEVFRAFAEIMHTVRTGAPAFEKVYGQSFYAYLDDSPAAARTFHESMGGQPVPAALSTCDLTGVRRVVDVGGGNGALLAELLDGRPGLRGVLLDRPEAASRARIRLADAGIADRVEVVEGSFFDRIPGGGDVYLLCRVLHNWTDERAVEILRRVHGAMCPGGRLIVLEELLPDPADPATGSMDAAAGLVDLLMLVTLEGHDRTAAEYGRLMAQAGFTVTAVRRGVLEAVPEPVLEAGPA
jgi:SAM-dependent methyltransferase